MRRRLLAIIRRFLPAWDLDCLFRAAFVHGGQSYDLSFPFCGLNDEELRTIAVIAFRSYGFRNLTADDGRTLAAIIRMQEFRQEDR